MVTASGSLSAAGPRELLDTWGHVDMDTGIPVSLAFLCAHVEPRQQVPAGKDFTERTYREPNRRCRTAQVPRSTSRHGNEILGVAPEVAVAEEDLESVMGDGLA
jgi:hypothetical protein